MVAFDNTCIQSGNIDVGNHEPPTADIIRTTSVLILAAWLRLFATEVISIPNETAAATEQIITINRLKKFEKISTLKKTHEKKKRTESCTTPKSIV